MDSYLVFIMVLLTGVIMLMFSLILYFFPPKKINNLYGYRTKKSMRSDKVWGIAQKYSSKMFIKSSVVLILSSILFLFFNYNKTIELIVGFLIIIATAIIPILLTEKKIDLYIKNNLSSKK